jgi:Ca-activated chloride channel family protein
MVAALESSPARGGKDMKLLMVVLAIPLWTLQAQSVRSLVNGGNQLYRDQKYTDAEVKYRKALEKDQALFPGKFNLGDALYQQGKFDEAGKEYESALDPALPAETRAMSYYNLGNSYLRQQKYPEAIKSYIESLKLRPADYDTKYNLSYALDMLKKQQEQKDQPKKEKKDQEKKDKKDQQDQTKQQQQQNQQQRPQPQEKQMSKADAERILNVLKNNERDVQKKLRARQAVRARTEKDW